MTVNYLVFCQPPILKLDCGVRASTGFYQLCVQVRKALLPRSLLFLLKVEVIVTNTRPSPTYDPASNANPDHQHSPPPSNMGPKYIGNWPCARHERKQCRAR